MVVGCPSYCIVCCFCRLGMLLSTFFVLVVVYVILLSRQPTHLTSSCVKESYFQNHLWEVLACYPCYPNLRISLLHQQPKKTWTLTKVKRILFRESRSEDGNDPWFAVFRLMTKEDLHKAARIGCEKSLRSTLQQGSNISLLIYKDHFSQFVQQVAFLQRMCVSRRYRCILL